MSAVVNLSFLGRRDLPRGIRNNNPGNLRISSIAWQGKIPNSQNTDRAFEQFNSVAHGLRAMATDLINDVHKGQNTLRKLIIEYAPPTENDTIAYINNVARMVGISPDQRLILDNELVKKIIRAKMVVENGLIVNTLIPDQQIDQALSMLNQTTRSRIKWITAGSITTLLAIAATLFF
jgi:hypothetical protein